MRFYSNRLWVLSWARGGGVDVFITDREQTIYGVTVSNNLISFERASPGTAL